MGFAGEGIPAAARPQGVDLIKLVVTGGVLDAKEKGVPGELKMAPPWCALRAPSHVTHRGRLIAKPNVRRNVVVVRELDKFL